MTYPSIQIIHVQTNVEYKHGPVRKVWRYQRYNQKP